MVRLFPPRKYWLFLALGIILVILINLALAIPFFATILVAAFFTLISGVPGPRGKLRKFFMWLFWLGGAELVLIGIIIILGFGLVGALSAAASAAAALFIIAIGVVLGLIFIGLGIVLFIIGSFIAD